MKIPTIPKLLMILILPCLLFILVFNFYAFDSQFYLEKFSEYKVLQNVPDAVQLNEKVIDFIKSKYDSLPDNFNEREKQHLWDVRKIISVLKIVMYALITLFALLLLFSAFMLKINSYIINFIGKVLVFGGFLTLALAAILFFLISSDFSAAFESFHMMLFKQGTYVFDPAKELIVNLYPEQLFMEFGVKISEGVVTASAILILLGIFMMLKSKKNKNKTLI